MKIGETVILKGVVTSGQGDFAFWIERLNDHYFEKTGLHLYPGTLNVQLDEPFSFPEERLRLEAGEYGGEVSVNLLPCQILGRKAFLLRTDRNEAGTGSHPKTIVEVATDVRLRELHGLNDGDEIEIELT